MVVFSIVMLVFRGVRVAEPFPEDMELLMPYTKHILTHPWIFWANYSDLSRLLVTPNGGVVRESSQNPLSSGLGIIVICPDFLGITTYFIGRTKFKVLFHGPSAEWAPNIWMIQRVGVCGVCDRERFTTWMSQEVSKWLGSVGYNPNIPHL